LQPPPTMKPIRVLAGEETDESVAAAARRERCECPTKSPS
jgi:hypothetical protein